MSEIQIDPKTGAVYQLVGYAKDSRRVFWADCPNCGPVPPTVTTQARGKHYPETLTLVTDNTYPGQRPLLGWCSQCGTTLLALREIMTPNKEPGPHKRCDRRCLEGKSVCRCACQGRCHGAGKCYYPIRVPMGNEQESKPDDKEAAA